MIIYNKDINTYDNVYKTILLIKEDFRINKVIPIIFHNDVKFIEPLFLILLLNLHDKYRNNKILVIDILDLDYSKKIIKYFENKNMIQEEKNIKLNNLAISEEKIDEKFNFEFPKKDYRQHHVYRMLLEFLDTGYFVKENRSDYKWNKYINDYENKYYKDIKDRENDYPKILFNKLNKHVIVNEETQEVIYQNVFFYFSKNHNDTLFQNNDETRHLLPIFKINNFPKSLFSNTLHYNNIYTKKDERKEIFEGLLTAVNDDFSRKEFESYLEKIFQIVKSNNQSTNLTNLIPPLKTLLFECIDNIKKHTNKDTNGYFCFYYDSINKQFKIIIYDDFIEGFLNTYKKTLENEFIELEKKFNINDIDEKIKQPFLDSISELNKVKSENDIKIDHMSLRKIFDTKGTFETHQIPRVIMHFGIPTLVTIINDVGGKFLIRLHRKIDEEKSLYYCLDNTNEMIKSTSMNGLDGTHIYITIPENAIYKIRNAQPLNLKSDDLLNINENKELIEKKIKEFVPITEKNSKSQCRIFDYNVYFKKEPKNSISDFLRDLYYHAYKLNVLDALVINFPIKKFELYLQNLVYILFINKEYNEESINPVNVVFFNKTSLDIVFIGGRNYSEFYNSNKLISTHYGKYHDKITDVLIDSGKTLENGYANTKIFYKTNNDIFVLPFELYDSSEVSIQRLIMNNLNENKIPLHVDVGKGIHVSEFYKFDFIFQSSRFIDRIVHKILEKMNSTIQGLDKKNIKFIGVGRYSNLLLATIHKSLNKKIEEYYLVLDNLVVKSNHDSLQEYIEHNKDVDAFFIFTPVSFDGKQIKKEIVDKYNNHFIFWLNAIQITLEGYPKENISNYYTLLELQLKKETYFKVNNNEGCKLCRNDFELPLYKISEKDYFSIEDCYFNTYKGKKLKSYLAIDKLKWAESMHFGHTERDNNHYLYYTKTIQFFNKNYHEIVKFLESCKTKINQQYDILENEILIIAPMHSTHNKFLTIVNAIIFDGKATIFQIDLKKSDNNFYENEMIDENTLFFYVDDEISSGTTIQNIYSLLKSNNSYKGFNGVIILIDRMLQQDENYIKQLININNKDVSEAIHLFTKLEIKPIKTTKYEECFLCKRKKEYKKLLKYAVLDINRFQIAKRICKLNIINHTTIDFEHGIKENNDRKIGLNRKNKDYIKMIAVDYINSKFKDFSEILNDDYNKVFQEYIRLENTFADYIYGNTIEYFGVTEKYDSVFKEICKFEASIALIKALSFPKIVYFKQIRHLATVILLMKIKEDIRKEPLEYIFDNEIILQLRQTKKEISNKSFLDDYTEKLNIDYLNFLYITAGYLNIQSILNIENLEHYFYLSTKKEEKDFNHILLQPYQFAVKMVSMNSIDRSKYLDSQIEEFFKNKKDAKQLNRTDYTLIEALSIENNYSISKVISEGISFDEALKLLIKNNNNIIEKVNICKKYIEEIIKSNFVEEKINIKVESIFVNENIHTKYEDFESYLDNLRFIDILDDFNEIDDDNSNIKHINRIVKGALSKEPKEAMQISRNEDTKEINKIDNTWANISVENFRINNKNKNCLLIRLVDMDIDELDNIRYPKAIENLWYKPIGCIAISCSTDKMESLNIAKIVLSIQNDLVQFIKEEFSHETFREILKRKDEEKRNEEIAKDYAMQISAINHSFKDQIDLRSRIDIYLNGQTNSNLDKETYLKYLSYFSYGLHHLSSLTSVNPNKIKEDLKFIDITESLNTYIQDGFFDGIRNFILSVPYFIENINKNFSFDSIDITGLKNESFTLKLEQVTHMNHICFELIFNAIKNYNLDEKKPVIKIYSSEANGIVFENKVKEDFSLEFMKEKLDKKSRIGIKFIEEILKEQNYMFDYKLDNENLKIIIKKDTDEK